MIRPEEVDFVSYPYEWSFGQLKAAALLTLDIQEQALAAGFTLRDASAFNVQFHRGRPILIDSLSFEPAQPGAPWMAYRQFCEHFLGPLALMAYRDVRLGLLQRDFVDGVPLDLVSTLLPGRTRLRLGILSHVHMHAAAQRRSGTAVPDARPGRQPRMSALAQRALLDSLKRAVDRLRWDAGSTVWADYATNTSYSDAATRSKAEIVQRYLADAGGERVWDLGANTGVYSAIAAQLGRRVIAWDLDAAAVERHWRGVARDNSENVLPLVLDLRNPSPSLGWALRERRSILERGNPDVVMALALVHHLAIGGNVPLSMVSRFLAELGGCLIIEFVPKEDPMVRTLLATRADVFPDYTYEGFEEAFRADWATVSTTAIEDSPRTLFHMRRRPRSDDGEAEAESSFGERAVPCRLPERPHLGRS
ncbi:MAG: SAM-dependent methyltransferase [Chloroflexota bacterium]|nr:SAM-dependent methyltransferase [Chloroflexota bacterium]